MDTERNLRARAARAAREYVAGTRTWDDFRSEFYDSRDRLVQEIVDLIEHEPKRGGFLGVSEEGWAQHQRAVDEAILKLEASTE